MPRLLAPAALLAVVAILFAQDRPGIVRSARGERGPQLDEIRATHVSAHLKFLSHDLLEGRAPSTRGGQLAAEYLAAQLALVGFAPAGDAGTYFQNVPVIESVVDPMFTLTAGGGAPLTYLTDIVAFSGLQTPTVDVDGEVVFVGYGIVAPEYRWNDYAGVDMRGKIALIMVNDPPAPQDEPSLFGGPALTYYGRWTYKYEEEARQGAAGAFLIHTEESATYPWQVVQSSWSGTQYSIPPAAGDMPLALKAWITDAAAHRMVMRAGRNLDALRTAARKRGAKPVPLGIRAIGSLKQQVHEKQTPNVIGVLKGRNPGQGILYSAHYDHFGIRDPKPGDPSTVDRIYNGAIDNASGVSGVLDIAQALARAATPWRSIYVLFTTAEESGLLGSEYFAAHPVLPPDAWAANINIDELNLFGRTKDIVLLGAERSTLGDVARDVAAQMGRTVGHDPEPGRGFFFRSDHFPFAKAGVPAVSISEPTQYLGKDPAFAKRLHDDFNNRDYHQPSDQFRADFDYAGAIEDLHLLAQLGWQVANASTMPSYHANEPFARPRAAASR